MNFPTPNSLTKGTHAVVIGGSIAGLLAGRILTDYFDKVTIITADFQALSDFLADCLISGEPIFPPA